VRLPAQAEKGIQVGVLMLRATGIPLLIFAVLEVSCAAGQDQTAAPPAERLQHAHHERATPAPDFTLDDLDGDEFRLSEHVGEAVMLLYFWASCCEPCRVEMPHLERLQQTYREQGFRVIAISMDPPETRARVRSFVSRDDYSFTVLLDEETAVMQVYNPRRASPFSALVDREGNVVWSREGYSPGDEVMLEELLRGELGLEGGENR
jgi:peroxiredoxin